MHFLQSERLALFPLPVLSLKDACTEVRSKIEMHIGNERKFQKMFLNHFISDFSLIHSSSQLKY